MLPTIYQKKGTDQTFSLSFTDSDDVAINILNYTIFFVVRKRSTLSDADNTNAVLDITASVTNPSEWLAELSITDTLSGWLDVGDYVYEISYKKPDDTRASHYGYWIFSVQYLSNKDFT